MAEARIETVPPVEPEKFVHLTLTMDEAAALRELAGAGYYNDPEINAIYHSLKIDGIDDRGWRVTTSDGGYLSAYRVKKIGR
jgi:hypothetical protein